MERTKSLGLSHPLDRKATEGVGKSVSRQSSYSPGSMTAPVHRKGGSAIQFGARDDIDQGFSASQVSFRPAAHRRRSDDHLEEGSNSQDASELFSVLSRAGKEKSQDRRSQALAGSDPEAERELSDEDEDEDENESGSKKRRREQLQAIGSINRLHSPVSSSPPAGRSSSLGHSSMDARASKASADVANILFKIRLVQESMAGGDQSNTLNILQEMEKDLLLSVGVGKVASPAQSYIDKLKDSELTDSFSLVLRQDSGPVDEEEEEPPFIELKVRVDQDSLLNSSASPTVSNSPTPDLSPMISRRVSRSISSTPETITTRAKDSVVKVARRRRSSSTTEDTHGERFITFLVHKDGRKILKDGHILDIMEWMINTEASATDLDTFLFSFRVATSPDILLDTLTVLYRFNLDPNRSQQIVRMLKTWVKKYYGVDFARNEELSSRLWAFVQTHTPSQLKTMKKSTNSWYNQHWSAQRRIPMTVEPFESASRIDLTEMDPLEIAEQITEMEWEFFKHFHILDCLCDEK